MKKVISIFIVVLFAGLTSCQSDRLSNESTVGPEVTRMADLTAPPTFDWSTHRSHKLILALGDQAPAPGKYLVKIYTGSVDDPAGARFSGIIDAQNPLVTDIQLPSSTEKIFARVFSPNGSSTTTELPNYETISHTFFRSQKTANAATTIASLVVPALTTAAMQPIREIAPSALPLSLEAVVPSMCRTTRF